jgi:hypothetical protein
MKGRCFNPHNPAFADYGGRGITVCEEWLVFDNFRNWAVSNGYQENAEKWHCTLDRIDVNKGYSPDNCRWVNMKTQGRNKRNNVTVDYDGRKCTLSELAEITGVKYQTLYARLTRQGKSRNELWGDLT